MRTTYPAHYCDGQVSTVLPAEVAIGPAGLTVHLPEREPLTWPGAEIQVVQGALPGQQVHLRRQGEWLTIPEAESLATLAAAVQQPHLQPQQSRRSLLTFGLRALVSLSLVASACYFWVLPASVDAATPHVPVAWETMLGDAVARQMVPNTLRVDAPRETEELERLLTLLTDEAKTPYQFRLVVSSDPAVNAFAAPGGTLILYAGLLERMSSPEELLGIMAHEVAHVKLRHTTQALLYNVGLQLLTTALTGDTTMFMLAWTLGSLHHSRQAEEEADREGMRLMQAARLNGASMVTAFQALEKAQEEVEELPFIPVYLSTHPETKERIRKLEAIAQTATYTPRAVQSRIPWEDIQYVGGTFSETDMLAE